jgi:hypothetical protein
MPSTGNPLRTVGRLILILGLVGVVVWGAMAMVASGMGTVDESSIAFNVSEVGALDPVNQPGMWHAKDSTGTVVWEGTEVEWQAITVEGEGAYQADLRTTWLYPSAAITAVGLVLYMIGRRRSSESGESR